MLQTQARFTTIFSLWLVVYSLSPSLSDGPAHVPPLPLIGSNFPYTDRWVTMDTTWCSDSLHSRLCCSTSRIQLGVWMDETALTPSTDHFNLLQLLAAYSHSIYNYVTQGIILLV